jgi:long-subunit fatty acid transport protein
MRYFTALLAAACVTTPAFATPLKPGQFAGSVNVGAELPLDGDVHGGAAATVASLAALNPNLPATSAQLRIESRSYDDIYGNATTYGIEGRYGLAGDREVFGEVRRTEADGGQVQVGTAFVPALGATLPVNGTFDDFKSTTVEAGVRQYFGSGKVRPYVAARAGVAFVDEIRASFQVPVPNGVGTEPNDINLNNVPFYDDSTTWSVGVDVGASWQVNERLSVSAETGIRYRGDLDGNDAAIGGLGLASINNDSAAISVPVTLKLSYAF